MASGRQSQLHGVSLAMTLDGKREARLWATGIATMIALLLALPCLAQKRTPDQPPRRSCRQMMSPANARTNDTKTSGQEAGEAWSEGTVTVGGAAIDYCAAAGTLTVHTKDWDDTAPEASGKGEGENTTKAQPAAASMFYAAYFKREAAPRPITFLFNGGPGSATLWLHMGAFGPRRVETADASYAPAAPYRLVNNNQSLLDVTDLVFIDAPGTGFSRVTGDDKDKAFYGIDEDSYAFATFITSFLSKYNRWNSPKYLLGESYGTTRAAALVNRLQGDPGMDFNGVIMLSQVLASGLYSDDPKATPGNDLPYVLSLPTFAATKWFYDQPPERQSDPVPPGFLEEVERFATGDYVAALAAGAGLEPGRREVIMDKLQAYTGLPAAYLRRSELRVAVDAFRQELLRERGMIVGTNDTRFRGYSMDHISKHASYDPTEAATNSAYVSAFNDYVRRVLSYGEGKTYHPSVSDIADKWNFHHQPPDSDSSVDNGANVLPDLARAMKYNPLLKIQLNAGLFDLITPYFQGKFEMLHLPIPAELQSNIEFRCYQAGHMPYLRSGALVQLHDNVANFIERTSNLPSRTKGPPRDSVSGCP